MLAGYECFPEGCAKRHLKVGSPAVCMRSDKLGILRNCEQEYTSGCMNRGRCYPPMAEAA